MQILIPIQSISNLLYAILMYTKKTLNTIFIDRLHQFIANNYMGKSN